MAHHGVGRRCSAPATNWDTRNADRQKHPQRREARKSATQRLATDWCLGGCDSSCAAREHLRCHDDQAPEGARGVDASDPPVVDSVKAGALAEALTPRSPAAPAQPGPTEQPAAAAAEPRQARPRPAGPSSRRPRLRGAAKYIPNELRAQSIDGFSALAGRLAWTASPSSSAPTTTATFWPSLASGRNCPADGESSSKAPPSPRWSPRTSSVRGLVHAVTSSFRIAFHVTLRDRVTL